MDIRDKEYVKKLIGEPFIDIGRAGDMLWLGFGEKIMAKDYKGQDAEKSSMAVHVQCPWRLIDRSRDSVVFASYDIYEPNSNYNTIKDFEWDMQGVNLFDQSAKEWKQASGGTYVTDVELKKFGDLKLVLSNECVFEVIINTTADVECWRFFECGAAKEHFVITGKRGGFE